ncbi:pH-dependent sodium/proton antiporter [Gallibacterium salpingitidis]|uniref:Na(+)/H(+) antiporter NhaA n=1 Tax=Gallibacterium salpingitidis TaxID=505341 RepID=A0AB36E100_9PAST|nr:Na+/H+ antiporter NhaA [Gallibacterium salpingitidis]OBX09363.1 pH-dependent sodium/proton antiporter [Gallibacterium salpingitidis]
MQKLSQSIQQFFKSEPAGGILLLIATFFAIVLANLSFTSQCYQDLLNTTVAFQFGEFRLHKPLLLWINDGLMAIFFLSIGLEVKKELFTGSLSNYKTALFPAIAAFGGMIVPALLFYLVTASSSELTKGWAIPMATDIAFALGIMALVGKNVPPALKIFLLALAIIDDLGAIVVIAIFFSHELGEVALVGAAISILLLFLLNRYKVSSLTPYGVVGIILWVCVLKSGVHATLAGVIIGFAIPLKASNGANLVHRLEHTLAPWVTFMILPLFAFANAGISFQGINTQLLSSPLLFAVLLGLFVGKPIGVFGFSYLSIKLKLTQLPAGINFSHIFAVSLLCGIGFTMSMFLSGLAFEQEAHDLNILARIGILAASTLSAILGFFTLRQVTK